MSFSRKYAGCTLALCGALILMSRGSAACDAQRSSETPVRRYEIKGSEVYDRNTGLIWSRCSVGQHWQSAKGCTGTVTTMSWEQAMAQDSGAWRVPTTAELESLSAAICGNPVLEEHVFPGFEAGRMSYWSSISYSDTLKWYVDFEDGNSSFYDGRVNTAAVRLVRFAK
jgi:Protein of unknown function (DUF1566)